MLETERLLLRPMLPGDADFIVALVNDPTWLRFIGDRNIRDAAAATAYMGRCEDMYRRHGLPSLVVTLKSSGAAIGLCGLVRRDHWEEIDLGYALLPAYRGYGYAREAAGAVLEFGHRQLQRARIVAMAHPENAASAAVLRDLGFVFERPLPGPDGTVQTHLFVSYRPPLTP